MSDSLNHSLLSGEYSRREILAKSALLLAAAGLPEFARAGQSGEQRLPRAVALEWSAVETLYALGLPPVAVSDITGYNNWVSKPAIVPGVAELGLRTEPNLELLASLAPDLLILPEHSPLSVPRLEQIAPVWQYSFAVPGKSLLSVATDNTLQLASRLGRDTEARQYLSDYAQQQAGYRQQLQPFAGKKILMFTLMSSRQALVLTPDSLFGEVLQQLGLHCAWQGATSIWGSVIIGIEQLLTCDADYVLQFSQNDQPLLDSLSGSPLWQQMPFNQNHRRWLVEPVWLYGSLYSAQRFAGILTQVSREWHA